MNTLIKAFAATALALAGLAAHATSTTSVLSGDLADGANPHVHDSDLSQPAAPDEDPNNHVALYQFTFAQAGTLTLSSSTYNGGAGFDPWVTLFTGNDFTATLYAGPAGPSAVDDFTWTDSVAAGSYWVAISDWENMSFAENTGSGTLGDGFIKLGDPNLYSDGLYAVTVTFDDGTVPPPPIPEPTSAALLGLGLATLAARVRRAHQASR